MIFNLIKKLFFIFIIFVSICYTNKSIRYLILSFFVEWLNEHETIGNFLGIKYGNDYSLYFDRKDSKIYTPGIFKILVEWFVGVDIKLDHSLYKSLIRKQFELSKKVKFGAYFILIPFLKFWFNFFICSLWIKLSIPVLIE